MAADQDFDAGEHAALQDMVLVREIHFDRHGAGGPVQRLDDSGNRAFKDSFGIGFGAHVRLLTHLDERDVFLHHLDQNADRLDLMEGEDAARGGGGAGGGAADIGAEIEVAFGHVAGEGRTDIGVGQVRFGLGLGDCHLLDLRAERVERRNRCVVRDLGVIQILLRDELVFDQRPHPMEGEGGIADARVLLRDPRSGCRQVGLGLVDGMLVIRMVDLDQELVGFHQVALIDVDLGNVAVHP